jgi:hypothetical protein
MLSKISVILAIQEGTQTLATLKLFNFFVYTWCKLAIVLENEMDKTLATIFFVFQFRQFPMVKNIILRSKASSHLSSCYVLRVGVAVLELQSD